MVHLIATLLFQAGVALYENPTAEKLIRQSMEAAYDLHLSDSRSAAQALQSQFPDHPAGFILMAETYWWQAQTDHGNETIENSYYQAQKLAVAKAEAALKAGKYSKTEITSYLASTTGSYARFQITQKGAFFSAMRAGLKAHGYAEDVYELDKNYYDIYVGLGAYNIFADLVPTVIKPFAWLFGASGDKQLGIQQLKTAMEKSRFAHTEAEIVYYTAMLEDKQYPEAFRTIEKLRIDHPDNFVLYTWASDWFRRQRKFFDGAEYFEKLSQSVSPAMAQYALVEKAQLQLTNNLKANAAHTLQRIKAAGGSDALINKKVQELEKKLR